MLSLYALNWNILHKHQNILFAWAARVFPRFSCETTKITDPVTGMTTFEKYILTSG